jgi:hypothetical protein
MRVVRKARPGDTFATFGIWPHFAVATKDVLELISRGII